MAKFELSVYNVKTEEKEKVCQRNLMPVSLYIKYQKLSEKLEGNKIKSDAELFAELKDIFLETFPELTAEEYMNQTDVGEVLATYGTIIGKATLFEAGNSKNV